MGRITTRHPVLRMTADAQQRRVDTLAVEEPLDVRMDGSPFVITMRTPGHDIDLVHGLLFAEGVIASAADVRIARYPIGPGGAPLYDVVDVRLAETATPAVVTARHVLTSSACGICGAETLEQLQRPSRYRLGPTAPVAADHLVRGPERLREAQRAFAQTGGLHAAGLMDVNGSMLCVREDVGRHNAVDKVVGWALRQGQLPLTDVVLVVSGRASYELTQKAVLAGIGVLVAVSAPSSMAVDLAAAAGLTLIGFARGTTMNVYTHPERVAGSIVAADDAGADNSRFRHHGTRHERAPVST